MTHVNLSAEPRLQLGADEAVKALPKGKRIYKVEFCDLGVNSFYRLEALQIVRASQDGDTVLAIEIDPQTNEAIELEDDAKLYMVEELAKWHGSVAVAVADRLESLSSWYRNSLSREMQVRLMEDYTRHMQELTALLTNE